MYCCICTESSSDANAKITEQTEFDQEGELVPQTVGHAVLFPERGRTEDTVRWNDLATSSSSPGPYAGSETAEKVRLGNLLIDFRQKALTGLSCYIASGSGELSPIIFQLDRQLKNMTIKQDGGCTVGHTRDEGALQAPIPLHEIEETHIFADGGADRVPEELRGVLSKDGHVRLCMLRRANSKSICLVFDSQEETTQFSESIKILAKFVKHRREARGGGCNTPSPRR